MSTQETVWIMKYALTDGVREVPLIERHPDGRYVTVKWSDEGWNNGRALFHGNDYHDTQEAAFARAEEMRKAKIVSHEKSIGKLRKLVFAPPSAA